MIYSFLNRGYFLILLVVVLVSYGQTLGMFPWQDDHALFFKLAHIQENAGFLGPGILGSGVYKYTATFYLPIYFLFGHNTVFYYAYTLLFYFIASLFVYLVFSRILGKSGGRIAALLYGAGFIASDGFIRLFNSVTTSLSIIFASLLVLSYWNFYQSGRIKWYFLAVGLFLASVELIQARTHYLLVVVLLFEFIFLAWEQRFKSLAYTLVRILPFVYIFYKYFILSGDHRTGQVGKLVDALIKGDFQQSYSFLSSLSGLIFPKWLIDFLFITQQFILSQTGVSPPLTLSFAMLFILIVFFLSNKYRNKNAIRAFFLVVILFWVFISKSIFIDSHYNLNSAQIRSVFIGGCILIVSSLVFFSFDARYRRIFAFLFLWILANIGAYAAYSPDVSFESINRYFAHSFLPLVGILSLVFIKLQKEPNFLKGSAMLLVILWGFGNLVSAVFYQKHILSTRSFPAKSFYSQLESYVPAVNKGDIFYFDIADNAREYFANAFSVAQMPETTAIAWHYGVDRYDIKRLTQFQELQRLLLSEQVPLDKVYTFWYSSEGLVDTSPEVRKLLAEGRPPQTFSTGLPFSSKVVLSKQPDGTHGIQPDLIVSLKEPIPSVVPFEITFILKATLLNVSNIDFPYISGAQRVDGSIWQIQDLRDKAIKYKMFRENFAKQVEFSSDSEWQDRTRENLYDGDYNTVWQADRVLWAASKKSFIELDLKKIKEVEKLVWVNGFANHTPTKYYIETSLDGNHWQMAIQVDSLVRIDGKELQIVSFKPVSARFVRMVFTDTLRHDSPALAELWIVDSGFGELDLQEANKFLEDPFGYVPNKFTFQETWKRLGLEGEAQLFWKGNKSEDWQTMNDSRFEILYDGTPHEYKLHIPAGGTQIDVIKIANIKIPGNVEVSSIVANQPPFLDEKKHLSITH